MSVGLKALTYVVQQDPKLALQHQMTIIECLDHPDLIIKREVRQLLMLAGLWWYGVVVLQLYVLLCFVFSVVDTGVAL